jgi:acetyl esterase/lipase
MGTRLPLILLCVAAGAQAQTLPGGATYYYGNETDDQALDVYLPHNEGFPTVLFVHGGSLVESGETRMSPVYHNVCEPFVRDGIGCATMDYRLAPAHQWPAMPQDVAAATDWLFANLPDMGGRTDRIFLLGHSSGCHLVALIATDPRWLAAHGRRPEDLAGVIPMGCTLNPYDTTGTGITPQGLAERFQRDRSAVEVYGTLQHRIEANPSLYVGSRVPPMLVVLAEAERFFPAILEQGARFVRLLLERDRPAELVIVPGRHMSSIESIGVANDPTFAAVHAFISTGDPASALYPPR